MTFDGLPGLTAAPHTPFHPDGSLRAEVVADQAAHLRQQGVAAAFVCGTTGEGVSLRVEERMEIVRHWMNAGPAQGVKVVIHVGANCLADAQALAAHAESLSVPAIAAFAPSYFKPANVESLVVWMREIASAAPRTPFYYYDIPLLTHVRHSVSEFLAAARERIPTFHGVKFTNSDLMEYQLCLNAAGGRIDVPWGCDEMLLAALALGARGTVGSTYNFAAPLYLKLWRAFDEGDLAAAREYQLRSVQLIQVLARHGYLGACKALMGMLGVEVGPPRLPNQSLSDERTAELRRELDAKGLLGCLAWRES